MRLALALHMPVSTLLDSMDSEELQMWRAYDEVYCLPDSWLQNAQLSSIMWNANFRNKRDITSFIPSVKEPQSQEEMLSTLRAFVASQDK